jgi:hypothetical protein
LPIKLPWWADILSSIFKMNWVPNLADRGSLHYLNASFTI